MKCTQIEKKMEPNIEKAENKRIKLELDSSNKQTNTGDIVSSNSESELTIDEKAPSGIEIELAIDPLNEPEQAIASDSCTTVASQSKQTESLSDRIARKLREGLAKLAQKYTGATNTAPSHNQNRIIEVGTEQEKFTTPNSIQSGGSTEQKPTLRLRPIDQLLSAETYVEQNSEQNTEARNRSSSYNPEVVMEVHTVRKTQPNDHDESSNQYENTMQKQTLCLKPTEQLLATAATIEYNARMITEARTPQPPPATPDDSTSDELNQLVSSPQEDNRSSLENIAYKQKVEAEMRNRIIGIAYHTLKQDNLKQMKFLHKFSHLPFDLQISRKINHKILTKHVNPITFHDKVNYDQYKGFMFEKALEQLQTADEDLKTMIGTPIPEYSDKALTMLTTDIVCHQCKVGHDVEATSCSSPQVIKNTTIDQLKNNHSWRKSCKAVIITTKALTKLPIIMQDIVINVQLPSKLKYEADRGSAGYDDKNSELYHTLMEIIAAIGFECTYPIFIEFMKSRRNNTALEYHHIAFVRICKEVQNQYYGIVIPVMGLHKPTRGEPKESYLNRKYQLVPCLTGAVALGRWLGIAVDIPMLQNMTVGQEENPKILPSWRNEPLFNVNAEPTREWYRRISIYLSSRISWLKPYYPLVTTNPLETVLSAASLAAQAASKV